MGLLSGSSKLSAPGARGRDLEAYLAGGVLTGGGHIPEGGVQPLIAKLRAVADRRGKTCSQVALNWIICKGAIPIPGACRVGRMEEYLGCLGWRLSEAEVEELEASADALPFEFEGAGLRFSSAKFVGYGTERWYLD
uniref:NADP-dependent oxidoreductase domain-containing protein n=1 Tax=Zooxanthella nutricula TaxID=1333877 RepID=A0A7S2VJ80_9DINO